MGKWQDLAEDIYYEVEEYDTDSETIAKKLQSYSKKTHKNFDTIYDTFHYNSESKEYFDIINYIYGITADIKTYQGKLELSDDRVMWEIDVDIDDYAYYNIVHEYCEMFSDKWNVDVELLGRSGRHVCVKDTISNRKNYDDMVNDVDEMQRDMIEKINSGEC